VTFIHKVYILHHRRNYFSSRQLIYHYLSIKFLKSWFSDNKLSFKSQSNIKKNHQASADYQKKEIRKSKSDRP